MGETVHYHGDKDTGQGYLALPSSGSGPAVIVVQEWWGLVPHIRSLVDRFADAGFVALAPHMSPPGGAAETGSAAETGGTLRDLAEPAIEALAADIAVAAAYLRARPETTGAVGVTGFAMGGTLALRAGALSEHVAATAAFYPLLPWNGAGPQWDGYAGKAATLHRAGEGGPTSTAATKTLTGAIESVGGAVTVYDYPGAGPAFFNDDRPETYHAEAARTAWARTLELFRSRLAV